MFSNSTREVHNRIVAQARLFIDIEVAREMNSNGHNFASVLEVSYIWSDAYDARCAMSELMRKYCSWRERVGNQRALARDRLDTRLRRADMQTRPYNSNALGHLYRSSLGRRPFTALAEAVHAMIKAERAGDRDKQRTGKQRLIELAYNCSYTSLVYEVMGERWPVLCSAVETAQNRFASGHWERPVWTCGWSLVDRHPSHFVHASRETPGNVAFYANTDKLEADKLTSMKPGRYLSAFYGDVLSAEQIKQLANKQRAIKSPVELKFVGNDDPLGWVWVYENSTPSCMRYNRSNRYINFELNGDLHPVTVYAHAENNLALAYIMLPGEVEDRRRNCREDESVVGARAIVNTQRKTYLRIYGEDDVQHTVMKEALARAGYTQSQDTLQHEKLRYVEVNDGYLCPYLDGHYTNVTVRSGHLLVGSGGMSARETQGFVCEAADDDDSYLCSYCDEHYTEGGGYVASVGAWVCDECMHFSFVAAVGWCGNAELHHNDSDRIVYCEYNDRYYVIDYLANNGMGMTEGGDVYPEEQLVATEAGVYHTDDAVELTYEFSGYGWARRDEVYRLPNGETCHVDDADRIAEIEALEQEAA